MQEINLNEMIDINTLQIIQDRFSDATCFSAITVDIYGNPLTEYSNFTSFCQSMRKNKKFKDKCHECDAHGGVEAARKGEPQIYRCHAGLIDFAVPIKVKGQFVGTVLGGQVKLDSEKRVDVPSITNKKTAWESNEEFSDAYDQLQETNYKKIEAGAQLMHSMINHFIEKDIINYVQSKLNAKNVELIEQLQKQADLEQDMKTKELKALQPQLNVNFIYNILNTASRMAILEHAEHTRDIIFDLEEYLIYIAKYRNKLVTLEDEITHIKQYLQLQLLRFGDRISFKLDIPESIQHEKLPALILQGIIDNAITHGLEPKIKNGLLSIQAEVVDQNIIFKIIDNGVGMSHHTLRQISKNKNESSSVIKTSGVDLYTVNMKLKNHYGSHYKFDISSELNEGTKVMLKIPRNRGGI